MPGWRQFFSEFVMMARMICFMAGYRITMKDGKLVYSTDPKLNQRARSKELVSECGACRSRGEGLAVLRIEKSAVRARR